MEICSKEEPIHEISNVRITDIIREPDPKAELIPISQDAIRDYCSALTAFQKQKPPFDERQGVLKMIGVFSTVNLKPENRSLIRSKS